VLDAFAVRERCEEVVKGVAARARSLPAAGLMLQTRTRSVAETRTEPTASLFALSAKSARSASVQPSKLVAVSSPAKRPVSTRCGIVTGPPVHTRRNAPPSTANRFPCYGPLAGSSRSRRLAASAGVLIGCAKAAIFLDAFSGRGLRASARLPTDV
jgi:hypothetical protein